MTFLAFVLSIAFVFYVYFGYPLLIWFLSRGKSKQYPKSSYQGDISIVMVVCNEAKNIKTKLENFNQLSYQGGNLQFLIVDDASDDNTCQLINESNLNIKLIENNKRQGKAAGINLAMAEIQTELVMLVDCRQTLEPDVIDHLSSWFSDDEKMGAVSGELMFKPEQGNEFSSGMDGYWRYEKFIRKSEALFASVPGVTGALYMLRSKSFRPIETNTLLDDVQIPMVSCAQGYRIGYDDRAIAWDVPSVSINKEKARKIRTLSGNYQLLFRFPRWITPGGHPIWWQFFSHKIARLLVPFSILLSLLLALKLSYTGSFIAAVYLMAVAVSLILVVLSHGFPIINRIKHFKLLQSFVVLNWFCLLAFNSYFFTNQTGSWRK